MTNQDRAISVLARLCASARVPFESDARRTRPARASTPRHRPARREGAGAPTREGVAAGTPALLRPGTRAVVLQVCEHVQRLGEVRTDEGTLLGDLCCVRPGEAPVDASPPRLGESPPRRQEEAEPSARRPASSSPQKVQVRQATSTGRVRGEARHRLFQMWPAGIGVGQDGILEARPVGRLRSLRWQAVTSTACPGTARGWAVQENLARTIQGNALTPRRAGFGKGLEQPSCPQFTVEFRNRLVARQSGLKVFVYR